MGDFYTSFYWKIIPIGITKDFTDKGGTGMVKGGFWKGWLEIL